MNFWVLFLGFMSLKFIFIPIELSLELSELYKFVIAIGCFGFACFLQIISKQNTTNKG